MTAEQQSTDPAFALRCEVKLWRQDEVPVDLAVLTRGADEIDRLRRAIARTVAACRCAETAYGVPLILRQSIADLEKAVA